MQNSILEVGALGSVIVGLAGFTGWIIKYVLDRNEKDKERHYKEREEQQTRHIEEINKIQNMYREELASDRSIYINSMDKVVGKLDGLEKEIEVIKANQINCQNCANPKINKL